MDALPFDIKKLLGSFLDPHSVICLKHTCTHFSFFEQKIPKTIGSSVIQHNSIPLVEYFVNLGCNELIPKNTLDALGFRAPNILTYLEQKGLFLIKDLKFYSDYVLGFYDKEKISNKCAIETLQWLLNNNFSFRHEIVNYACYVNDFETLKWLISKKYKVSKDTCNIAAKTGNLEMLKWLLQNGYKRQNDILQNAATGGNLDMLIWLKDRYYPNVYKWDSWVANNAASFGHFHILKWLNENKYNMPDDVCNWAAMSGNVEMLDWLYNNFDCETKSIAFHGRDHIDVIKWCIKNDIKISGGFLVYLEEGKIPQDVVEYLKQQNII